MHLILLSFLQWFASIGSIVQSVRSSHLEPLARHRTGDKAERREATVGAFDADLDFDLVHLSVGGLGWG